MGITPKVGNGTSAIATHADAPPTRPPVLVITHIQRNSPDQCPFLCVTLLSLHKTDATGITYVHNTVYTCVARSITTRSVAIGRREQQDTATPSRIFHSCEQPKKSALELQSLKLLIWQLERPCSLKKGLMKHHGRQQFILQGSDVPHRGCHSTVYP